MPPVWTEFQQDILAKCEKFQNTPNTEGQRLVLHVPSGWGTTTALAHHVCSHTGEFVYVHRNKLDAIEFADMVFRKSAVTRYFYTEGVVITKDGRRAGITINQLTKVFGDVNIASLNAGCNPWDPDLWLGTFILDKCDLPFVTDALPAKIIHVIVS